MEVSFPSLKGSSGRHFLGQILQHVMWVSIQAVYDVSKVIDDGPCSDDGHYRPRKFEAFTRRALSSDARKRSVQQTIIVFQNLPIIDKPRRGISTVFCSQILIRSRRGAGSTHGGCRKTGQVGSVLRLAVCERQAPSRNTYPAALSRRVC